MGVRGLQSYLEYHCPSACPTVNISNLLASKRQGDGEAIIVVDGLTCATVLYENLEWIGGGQLKELKERAEQFVIAFRKIGVRLVFFFDGLTQGKKRQTWVKRRMDTLNSVYHVLDAISQGRRSENIDRSKYFIKPPGIGQVCREVFDIECGCKVYQSLAECDVEIAEYARTHGAVAILAQDSDFIILDKGESLYLSMQHLNLRKMETQHYDSRALASCLGIQLSQLPLLATFMGNDIVANTDLKGFHYRILNQTPNTKIHLGRLVQAIATYIRALPTNERLFLSNLSAISQKVLGNSYRQQDILNSIKSYSEKPVLRREVHGSSTNDGWSILLRQVRKEHVKNTFSSMIHAIMNEQTFESATIIEDYRVNDLPVFATVTLPIRKRLYGILLQEKGLRPGEEHKIEEWCMAGPNSLDGPNFVTAEPPAQKHPGLIKLWINHHINLDTRWQLFVHSVSSQLDVLQLKSIPAHLVIPTMILFLISDYLESWEVDAMLATSAILKHYSTARLAKLPSDPVFPRGIRIASLTMQVTFVLYVLLAACGYPLSKKKTAPWTFFDGKLFQAKYVAAKSGVPPNELCEHMVNVQEDFQKARQVVMKKQY